LSMKVCVINMITILDYGVGNIGALLNMFDYLGLEAEASSDGHVIANAEQLVLPGIGAFDKAMSTLRTRGLIEPLNQAVQVRKVPVLGVCLGMQLLARRSEEGEEPGLGWIQADVRRISVPDKCGLKVPNIGWLDVQAMRQSVLFNPNHSPERFYFDHGFHVVCDQAAHIAAVVEYGGKICCAVEQDHIYGVQFHPEKSHRFGMRLLKDFAALKSKE
jgi:imidazole glycerol-phosphate synthase subunit HisH